MSQSHRYTNPSADAKNLASAKDELKNLKSQYKNAEKAVQASNLAVEAAQKESVDYAKRNDKLSKEIKSLQANLAKEKEKYSNLKAKHAKKGK